MARATNAVARKKRKKKVLDQAKGYYGRLGLLALVLLGIGMKAKDKTCLSVSALIILLLMTQARA